MWQIPSFNRLRLLVLACIVLVMAQNAAQASAVLYTFASNGGFDFSYTAPDFVTTDTVILAADLQSCRAGFHPVPVISMNCDSIGLIPSGPTEDRIDFTIVGFCSVCGPSAPTVSTSSFRFPHQSLGAVGSYEDIQFRTAHLDVTLVNTAVPEPGSLALLVIGATGLWWWKFRASGAS
jgi:hypothetical protein